MIPEGDWLCEPCSMQSSVERISCCVCPNESERAFKKTKEKRWIHVSCALWLPEPIFSGDFMGSPILDVPTIDPRRFELICSICKKKNGACLQCSFPSCLKAFHGKASFRKSFSTNFNLLVPCGVRAGMRFEMRDQDCGSKIFFHQFCSEHASKSLEVDSVNSLGTDFMRRRKRKVVSDDINPKAKRLSPSGESSIVLLPTKLDSSQKNILKKFCKLFSVQQQSSFHSSVTHIICNCFRSNGAFLNSRTTKLQFGVITGKWIMCFDWITGCINAERILPEEDFEVKHDPVAPILPRSSRLNREEGIFRKVHFVLIENDIQISILEDLRQLIVLEQGIIHNSIGTSASNCDDNLIQRILKVILSEELDFLYVVTPIPDRYSIQDIKAKLVTPSWIFDCISNLKLM